MFGSWHGLVGFGIPIAGLNNPSLIEAVKSQPNKVLIGQLCRDRENGTPSSYLIELKHRFESCCKRKERSSSHAPEVLYFWERHYSQPRTVRFSDMINFGQLTAETAERDRGRKGSHGRR